MKISRLIIKNYRNLKDIDICLGETVVLVGENNSGKSNLLRAVTLPFLTDESSFSGKSLSWIDINDTAKEKYYHYIIENQKSIVDGTIKCSDFIKEMPVVRVEVQLKADVTENYFVKDLSYSVENGELMYGLRYEYKPSKAEEIFKLVKHVLMQETVDEFSIKKRIINLIPDERNENEKEVVYVNSIDSIKGQEGNNCLLILTTDLAAYLLGTKTEETIFKNRLYVGLTRSLEKLTIYITPEVEKKYGKEKVKAFFNDFGCEF